MKAKKRSNTPPRKAGAKAPAKSQVATKSLAASQPQEVAQPIEILGDLGRVDSFCKYLREIGKVALLTPKEELALAKRIRRGDKAARKAMIEANLRLVVKIARDYENRGLPLLDLISEGNIGLMKGVERFDHRKGAKLSTYGSWWIKQAIKRALSFQSKTVRLPVHIIDRIIWAQKFINEFEQDFERCPTTEEIADGLDLTVSQVKQMQRATESPPVSLDAPLETTDGETNYSEITADPNIVHPSEVYDEDARRTLLRRFLKSLAPRELEVIELRFGLNGYPQESTLQQVGDKFGVTRERIRQIEELARKRLYRMFEAAGVMGN